MVLEVLHISVNSCNSDAVNVVCGVPQGYISGPNLFLYCM